MKQKGHRGLSYAVTYKRPSFRGRVAYHDLFITKGSANKFVKKLKRLSKKDQYYRETFRNPRVKKIV